MQAERLGIDGRASRLSRHTDVATTMVFAFNSAAAILCMDARRSFSPCSAAQRSICTTAWPMA